MSESELERSRRVNARPSTKKPLSDEEIKELIKNFPIIFSPQDLLSFARAIEERHKRNETEISRGVEMSLNNVTKVNQECNSSEQNKPVVYWDGKHFASKDKSSLADIPLYTHPHKEQEPDLYSEDGFPLWTSPQFKELTDEEILEIAKESYVWNVGKQEWSEIEFAKAILRKAQEK